MNISTKKMVEEEVNDKMVLRVVDLDLIGIEFMWSVVLDCTKADVVALAMKFLPSLYKHHLEVFIR